jgi:hypothetical protein
MRKQTRARVFENVIDHTSHGFSTASAGTAVTKATSNVSQHRQSEEGNHM